MNGIDNHATPSLVLTHRPSWVIGFDIPQQERPGAHLKRLSFVTPFYDGCCEGSSERRSLLRGMSTLQHPSPSLDIGGGGLPFARGHYHV